MNNHNSISEAGIIDLIKQYELAYDSQDFSQISNLTHPNATFIFSEGRFVGLESIRKAFEKIWSSAIDNQDFKLSDIKVLCTDTESATITFQYYWKILINGLPQETIGRGTCVIVKNNDKLQIIHKHLSPTSS